jgi:hypothetical protein
VGRPEAESSVEGGDDRIADVVQQVADGGLDVVGAVVQQSQGITRVACEFPA